MADMIRAVHVDLKGVPPTAERLVSLLRVIRAAGYNAALVEWEDMFPWTVDLRFRCETAYTPDQVRRFHRAATEAGIELVPLVQSLGHMETPLSVPGYERLREVPHQSDALNPLAPGARELVQRMVDDVLALLPGLRFFHLGGDEAWTFGTHPDTKAYVEQHGKGALYLQYVEPIIDSLNARGIRPLLWHDMMSEWAPEPLRRLGYKADLVVWGYTGHPDTTSEHWRRSVIERFREHGIPLWGATAYKGGDSQNTDLPNAINRETNALAWAEVAHRYKFRGLIATAWSRWSTHQVQDEPIDAALDLLMHVGAILRDGEPPPGGIEAARTALEPLGERTRFEACRSAMERLTRLRQAGWRLVQEIREQVIVSDLDARRRNSFVTVRGLLYLRKRIAEADALSEEVRRAFAGLIEPVWIERYLAERLVPLREEFDALSPRLCELNPDGHRGVHL